MKHATPIVISYLRFSRAEQLKGDSIRRQLALGEEWAARNKMKIADSYRDLGVSAFRGKNAAEGSLARFLKLVDDGQIPSGSVLLVEQLDRLSRNALLEALELFLSIIRRGIRIVTLMDGQEYTRASLNANMQGLMYSIMQMSLAHEESVKKSDRLSHAWAAKRSRIDNQPLTRRLPAWLKMEDGKIVIDPSKAAIVKKMVKLALAGYGLTAITQKMNQEAEGLARVKYFFRSYTFKILHNRALIGEFQPHRLTYQNGRKMREPIGDPVSGYYPRLISDDQFYAIQQKLASRRLSGGPQSQFINIFQGLLYDFKDKSPLHLQNKGNGRRYVSSAAINGKKDASAYIGFPVSAFERAVLLQLHDQIIPQLHHQGDDSIQTKIEALEAKLAEIDKRISTTQAAMLSDAVINVVSVVAMLAKLGQRKKELAVELTHARGELAARAAVSLSTVQAYLAQIVTYYKKGDTDLTDDERVEIRSIIAQVVERIDCDLQRYGRRNYFARINVRLKDGDNVSFDIFARYIPQMKRGPLGHPIKSDGPMKDAIYKVSLGDPQWIAVPDAAGKTYKIAELKGKTRSTVTPA